MADYTVKADVDTFIRSNNQAEMRTNIGAGTIATQNANNVSITGGSVTGITDLAVADGGTGASTAAAARTNLEVYSDAEVDAKVATKAVPGGVYFDGVDGAVAFTLTNTPETVSASFSFSVHSWIALGGIVVNGAATGATSYALALVTSSTAGSIQLRVKDSTGTGSVQTVTGIETDRVYNGVIIYDKAATSAYLYLDGVLSATITGVTDRLLNDDWGIGNGNPIFAGRYGNVTVRNLTIFNRALSASEVADLYESGTVAVEDRWGENDLQDQFGGVYSAIGGTGTISSSTSTGFTIDAGAVSLDVSNISQISKLAEAGQTVVANITVSGLDSNGTLELRTFSGYGVASSTIALTNGTADYTFVATGDAGHIYPSNLTSALGGSFQINSVRVLGAIADLPLDEGTGTKFYDRSPNNYNATGSDTGITHLLPIEPRDERERLGVTAQLNTKETAGGVAIGETAAKLDIAGSLNVRSFAFWYKPLSGHSGTTFSSLATSNSISTGRFSLGHFSSTNIGLALANTSGTEYSIRFEGLFDTYLNEWIHIACVDTGSNLELYINGTLQTPTSTSGTYPTMDWTDGYASIGGYNGSGSGINKNGQFGTTTVFNRALTATEVQDLHDTNTVAVADRWGEITPFFTNDFSSSSGWTTGTGWSIGSGVASCDGTQTSNSNLTRNVTSDLSANGLGASFGANVGKTFKITFTISNYTAGTLKVSPGGYDVSSGFSGNGTFSVDITIVNSLGNTVFYLIADSNFAGDVDDVSITLAGAIADLPLDEGIGYQFHDRSSNHFDALASTSGVTHLVPKTEGYIRDFNVDAYNGGSGNTGIVDTSRDILPQGYAINDLVLKNNAGADVTGTITLFSTTGSSTGTYFSDTSVTAYTGAVVNIPVEPSGSVIGRNRLLITASDADATDLDVRVDYKVIE